MVRSWFGLRQSSLSAFGPRTPSRTQRKSKPSRLTSLPTFASVSCTIFGKCGDHSRTSPNSSNRPRPKTRPLTFVKLRRHCCSREERFRDSLVVRLTSGHPSTDDNRLAHFILIKSRSVRRGVAHVNPENLIALVRAQRITDAASLHIAPAISGRRSLRLKQSYFAPISFPRSE